jgi:Kef-type K+ transport system membrane component KefB
MDIALEAGERAGGTVLDGPSIAREPARRFWRKVKEGLGGAVLGLCLFIIGTALIGLSTGNSRDFVIGQGALAVISLQFAILANRRSSVSRVRAIFSVTTFMMGLLSAGALCLDLLSRSAIGRAVPDGLFLGVLGFVLCAYVLFVWRYVGRPVAN